MPISLLQIEGVDAYLAYLGFEETGTGKLVCPDDQPPRSVIMSAQECCKDFIREWKGRDRVLKLLSESSKNLLEAQKPKPAQEAEKPEQKAAVAVEPAAEEAEEKELVPVEAGDKHTLRQLVWSITHEANRDDNKTADVLLL